MQPDPFPPPLFSRPFLTRLSLSRPRPSSPTSQSPASAVTFDELQGLTYLQVKGSGIANTCPVVREGRGDDREREGRPPRRDWHRRLARLSPALTPPRPTSTSTPTQIEEGTSDLKALKAGTYKFSKFW